MGRQPRERAAEWKLSMSWPVVLHYLSAHWLETAGVITTVLGIWLTTRRLLICWPVVLAADVLYLHALWQRLEALLQRENRLALAEACFAFLPARAELDLLGYEDPDLFAH